MADMPGLYSNPAFVFFVRKEESKTRGIFLQPGVEACLMSAEVFPRLELQFRVLRKVILGIHIKVCTPMMATATG